MNYTQRVQGRKMMGGQSTYIPLKVNAAGVIPIIFASCLIYFPALAGGFIFNVGWLTAVAVPSLHRLGQLDPHRAAHRVLRVLLHLHGVVQSGETADNLRKQGRLHSRCASGHGDDDLYPERAASRHAASDIFIAAIAVVPTIIFYFTGNTLIQAFGGTSILIASRRGLDTM